MFVILSDVNNLQLLWQNILPKTRHLLDLESQLHGPRKEKWKKFEDAAKEYLAKYYDDAPKISKVHDKVSFPIPTYKCL